MSSELFKCLEIAQLKNIISTLRLGATHLERILTTEHYSILLKQGNLNEQQYSKLSADKMEKFGQMGIVLNAIITGTFGAWMGFHAFAGKKLNSVFQFQIISIYTISLCALFSYLSFRFIKKSAQNAIINQKLLNIELVLTKEVAKELRNKNQALITSINQYLVEFVGYLQQSESLVIHHFQDLCDSKAFFFNALKTLNKQEYEHSSKIRNNKIVLLINELTDQFSIPSHKKISKDPKKNTDEIRYLLIDSPAPKLPKLSFFNWIKNNRLALLIGVFPTLFGCFGSMFVFLAGGPDIAKSFGFWSIFHTIKQPALRLYELTGAVLLTSYYGASFAYNNYKLYNRNTQAELTKRSIAKIEGQIAELEHEKKALKQVDMTLAQIIDTYQFVEQLLDCKTSKERNLK